MFLIDSYTPFLQSVIACPISKEPLERRNDELLAPCGFIYPNGDLRVGLEFTDDWNKGQRSFESQLQVWLNKTENSPDFLARYDNETADIYEHIKLTGKVLDVAGGFSTAAIQGSANLDTYISLDVYPSLWSSLAPYKRFMEHYSLVRNLPRITACAEFLPILTGSIDTVHMRSCVDHFANPRLALRESYRVLKPNGKIIIGIALEGAYKKEAYGIYENLKRIIKKTEVLREIHEKLFDHHMFHPTHENIRELLCSAGFIINKEVWSKSYHNVIYLEAYRK